MQKKPLILTIIFLVFLIRLIRFVDNKGDKSKLYLMLCNLKLQFCVYRLKLKQLYINLIIRSVQIVEISFMGN